MVSNVSLPTANLGLPTGHLSYARTSTTMDVGCIYMQPCLAWESFPSTVQALEKLRGESRWAASISSVGITCQDAAQQRVLY